MVASPDSMQLKQLHVDSLAPSGYPYEFYAGSGLWLSELKMTDIGGTSASGSCRLVHSLMASCIRLEHIDLQFNVKDYKRSVTNSVVFSPLAC